MRTESAYAAKGSKGHGRWCQKEPREGTKLRELYDLLKATPAYPVLPCMYHPTKLGVALTQLRDYYGLDIRVYPKKHGVFGTTKFRYWLVGEYIGKDYIDYVAARREKEERDYSDRS